MKQNKLAVFGVIALFLVIGLVFGSIKMSDAVAEEEDENTINNQVCGPQSCGGKCGGECGIPSCRCNSD